MARREVTECDKCGKPGRAFVLWVEGEQSGLSVDLCETHSRSVTAVFADGSPVDLPSKPRARMERTVLKTTARTQHLKKRTSRGKEDASARPDETPTP